MKQTLKNPLLWLLLILALLTGGVFFYRAKVETDSKTYVVKTAGQVESAEIKGSLSMPEVPKLDVVAYDKKLMQVANNPKLASTTPTSTKPTLWPVKTVYPNAGALLPFNRIIAYYGNLYSRGMGVLGEYPEEVMLQKLDVEVKKWEEADPTTPVIPALHYIAVVAQAGPGKDGKYRARMPYSEIDKVLVMAEKIHGIVFLDIQVGLSNVQTEVPLLEKYLKLPNVHLGIDPEFAMQGGARPGTVIGTLDATDINFAASYLAKVVQENNLPPKVFIVHRFTQPMLTNYKKIIPLPEVQIVIQMDGFGSQGSKLNTYKQFIYKEPVQFTGFKLFYKNDIVNGPIFTPKDLLKLNPIPVYIQFQ